LLRRHQPALRLDLQLVVGRRLAERRRADIARRNLDIVAAQCRNDVVDGQVARGRLVRIDPNADRVVARGAHGDVADTRNSQQRLLDLKRDIVGNVSLIQRAVRRVHVHGHQDVGRTFSHDDAGLLDLLRQTRHCRGHAVLDEFLRRVEIRAELERDRDLQIAVAGRLRGHIKHVLHAVDLFLERICDRFGDGFGRSTRIGQSHIDGGRNDLGILSGPQIRIGNRAQKHDEDRNNDREYRPVDHEVRESHPACTQ